MLAPHYRTVDPILKRFRFTNVRREWDRTTLWMRQNLVPPPPPPVVVPPRGSGERGREGLCLLIYNATWFRLFGTIEFGAALGWQSIAVDEESIRAAYRVCEKPFTAAYIVPPMYNEGRKVDGVIKVLHQLWKEAPTIVAVAQKTKSLQAVFEAFEPIKYIGGFLSYEIVSDLRYTELLADATDAFTWAHAGPGAQRGLNRLSNGTRRLTGGKQLKQPEMNAEMQTLLPLVQGVIGPEAEMRDVEHCLCEYDKWARAFFGEGLPKQMYRPYVNVDE